MRLEVTRRSDLAIRALLALGAGDSRTKAADLAASVGTTQGFLIQVMNPLVRAGWVRSDPGPTGGYSAVFDPEEVSLLAVVEAVEGPLDNGRCVLADRDCDQHDTCALHHAWARARTHLRDDLAAERLASVAVRATT